MNVWMYEWDSFFIFTILVDWVDAKKGYYSTKKIRKYIRMNWRVRYEYINMLCIWLNYMSRIFPFQWMNGVIYIWACKIFFRLKYFFCIIIWLLLCYDFNYSSETHRLIMLSSYWEKKCCEQYTTTIFIIQNFIITDQISVSAMIHKHHYDMMTNDDPCKIYV